ncbi:MAG: UDP-N-acetylmuramoyl-L-alanyl-D-glutamate--2,6-diaminopimelate ligase [Polyangia bacterium]
MKLSDLLRGVAIERVVDGPQPTGQAPTAGSGPTLPDRPGWPGWPDWIETIDVAQVCEDSRQLRAGDLFVAVPGRTVDGHRFLADARIAGAVAAVVAQPHGGLGLVQLVVRDPALALAQIAANFFGHPADALMLVGITGTNGKTTTNFLIESMLDEAGLTPGLIGTIVYRCAGRSQPAPFTTPTPLILHRTLGEMAKAGARAVTMEVSSHALALGRLHGLRFRVAAFTHLTQDHLDLHGSMDRYFEAKASLFREHLLPASEGGMGVVLVDDVWGRRLAAELPADRRLTVSLDGPADISLASERVAIDGITATLRTPIGEIHIQSALSGRFNLANLAVAAGIGVALGLSPQHIARGLSRILGVPGRLERVASRGGRGPAVFVDYAHTPDALTRVLLALRPLAHGVSAGGTSPGVRRGRLLVVFGCGGDRDVGKRPLMGQAAAQDADVVIVTSDNPRSEPPLQIIDAIVPGIEATAGAGGVAPQRLERGALATAPSGYFVEPDRRQAIVTAILAARPEDVVLLAGKGHEDYQIIGSIKHSFDDREEAQKALAQRPDSRPDGPPRTGSPPSSPGVSTPSVAATIELPLERVLGATAGKLLRGGAHRFSSVVIDSRAVTPGCLFVALRGEKHDGHSFLAQAVAGGAVGVLIERERASMVPEAPGLTVIEVADTVVALGQIARAHREAPEIAGKLRLVAVTGSSGKTTTKDLIASILAAHAGDPAEVCKTEGNLNNHLGVPLTLLRLRPGQRYAVVEMGMSARGEIAYLASLARPDVGVITNVAEAHLEHLGTLENIAAAKGELFMALADGATAVFGQSPRHALVHRQAAMAGALGGRLRGLQAQVTTRDEVAADGVSVQVRLLAETSEGLELSLHFPLLPVGNRQRAQLPLLGAHHAENAALAAAAALALDVGPAAIALGLVRARPGKHRGQLQSIGDRHLIDDCYNANPASMAAALRTLSGLRGTGRGVAVLGDMLELGPTELELHARIGEVAAECGLHKLIAVGQRARHIASAAKERGVDAVAAADAEDAASLAAQATRPGDWILVKGSRGMALEAVIARLHALLDEKSGAPAPTGA